MTTNLGQRLYFASLAGAAGGLLAWGAAALISAALFQHGNFPAADFVASLAVGGFIGGAIIGFADRDSGSNMSLRAVATGFLIGLAAGGLATLIQVPVATNLAGPFPGLARIVSWLVLGSLVGFGLGLRWVRTNRLKAPYGLTGGMAGGCLAGMLFAALGRHGPDFVQALAFILTGAGISLGIALAPTLVQRALLQFVSSGDGRAQSKLSRANRGTWSLEQGQSYTIGSQEPGTSGRLAGGTIFIPDAAVAGHHAMVFGRRGRFYLARHPEISGEAGLARFVLRLRGRTLVRTGELRDNDDILVGRTALRFASQGVLESE
jgi:hypothetical protein